MVQSRVQYGPQWERTDAPLQQSQQAQSRIVHAKPDCPLHQVREALSPSPPIQALHGQHPQPAQRDWRTTYGSGNRTSVLPMSR
jgi:hypothetical protein